MSYMKGAVATAGAGLSLLLVSRSRTPQVGRRWWSVFLFERGLYTTPVKSPPQVLKLHGHYR